MQGCLCQLGSQQGVLGQGVIDGSGLPDLQVGQEGCAAGMQVATPADEQGVLSLGGKLERLLALCQRGARWPPRSRAANQGLLCNLQHPRQAEAALFTPFGNTHTCDCGAAHTLRCVPLHPCPLLPALPMPVPLLRTCFKPRPSAAAASAAGADRTTISAGGTRVVGRCTSPTWRRPRPVRGSSGRGARKASGRTSAAEGSTGACKQAGKTGRAHGPRQVR